MEAHTEHTDGPGHQRTEPSMHPERQQQRPTEDAEQSECPIGRLPAAPAMPAGEIRRLQESRKERLGFGAWLETLGSWHTTQEALRRYDHVNQAILHRNIIALVNRLVRGGRGSGSREMLRHF